MPSVGVYASLAAVANAATSCFVNVGVNATRLKTKDKKKGVAREESQLNYKRMIWYILNINEEGGFCEHSQNIIDRYVDPLKLLKAGF
jgi:hypothetical protein